MCPANPFDIRHGNVAGILWRAAAERASAVAIVDGETRMTFGGLRDRAAAIAEWLRDRGIVPGDRVALLQERSADAAAMLFGTMALGAVAVCINDRLRPRQIEHMLRHSGARALVTTREMLGRNPRPLETDAEIWDFCEIDLTRSHQAKIQAFRQKRQEAAPWVFPSR